MIEITPNWANKQYLNLMCDDSNDNDTHKQNSLFLETEKQHTHELHQNFFPSIEEQTPSSHIPQIQIYKIRWIDNISNQNSNTNEKD